jgi:hypothetical protein
MRESLQPGQRHSDSVPYSCSNGDYLTTQPT